MVRSITVEIPGGTRLSIDAKGWHSKSDPIMAELFDHDFQLGWREPFDLEYVPSDIAHAAERVVKILGGSIVEIENIEDPNGPGTVY